MRATSPATGSDKSRGQCGASTPAPSSGSSRACASSSAFAASSATLNFDVRSAASEGQTSRKLITRPVVGREPARSAPVDAGTKFRLSSRIEAASERPLPAPSLHAIHRSGPPLACIRELVSQRSTSCRNLISEYHRAACHPERIVERHRVRSGRDGRCRPARAGSDRGAGRACR